MVPSSRIHRLLSGWNAAPRRFPHHSAKCARVTGLTKLTSEEMRLASYPDSKPEIDACRQESDIAPSQQPIISIFHATLMRPSRSFTAASAVNFSRAEMKVAWQTLYLIDYARLD